MVLNVQILTRGKVFWEGEAVELVLPTEGQIVFATGNKSFLTCVLHAGALLICPKRDPNLPRCTWKPWEVNIPGWITYANLGGGYVYVDGETICIFVDTIQTPASIDPSEAKEDFEYAKENFEKAVTLQEKLAAISFYQCAAARFSVVKDAFENLN
jgi:F-type H+-transporting ATPase subunit epsilon